MIKWVVIMTYLTFASPGEEIRGLAEELATPTESCAELMIGTDYDKWVSECIHTATPEPIVYETVTELLQVMYDTREKCQASVDNAMSRWTELQPKERLTGLTLKCFRVEIEE